MESITSLCPPLPVYLLMPKVKSVKFRHLQTNTFSFLSMFKHTNVLLEIHLAFGIFKVFKINFSIKIYKCMSVFG